MKFTVLLVSVGVFFGLGEVVGRLNMVHIRDGVILVSLVGSSFMMVTIPWW